MALGKIIKKTYLSISKGQIMATKGGEKEYYTYVEGDLEDIYTKERTFNGQTAKFWYIDLRDGEDLYSLCIPYESGVYLSICLSLGSIDDYSQGRFIRIEPYIAQEKTKVRVFHEGVSLSWVTTDLPPVEEVVVGSRRIKDTSKRLAYLEYVTEVIKDTLRKTSPKISYNE